MIGIEDVRSAAGRIAGQVIRTPLLEAPRLSALTGADVRIKFENLQATGAFKERGALNRLLLLDPVERKRGVVAMSAGNHAQAVAWHARRLGISAMIVMPRTTPFVKVANTEALGARVVLEGETVAECRDVVRRAVETDGLVEIHPYDDPHVMAGQGTIALEILEDCPAPDAIVVPVGGGGLISGVATAAKAVNPACAVYGVQTESYPSMVAALEGRELPMGGDTLAEGIAVKGVSQTAVGIVRKLVEKVLVVSEQHIEAAIYAYLTRAKTMAEGAGAAPLAALLADPARFEGRNVVLVLCGGNIDPRMLSAVTVRALEREERIVELRITARDRPGILGRITSLVGEQGGNILDVAHRRYALNVPAMAVSVDLTIETRDKEHAGRIVAALTENAMTAQRLAPGSGEEDF
ncbi:MAG: threonine ammonia-lyase [Flavobacteriaceae bacterium]